MPDAFLRLKCGSAQHDATQKADNAMSSSQAKIGLTVLRWSLGVVILIEAVRFVLPSAAHEFARTHMPGFIRMVLGFGEILGCILLLIPKTSVRGAWLLLAVFVMAILIHLPHGMYGIGNLLIYAAAAFAIAVAKG
jgi:uncharacterized membrane protein YphA (DoxX/SURF4 family)